MIAEPVVEAATHADVEAIALLRTQQGWQRASELLHAIQSWDGGRIFVVRQGSLDPDATDPLAPIATTCAIAAAPVGVVGNVIVRADYRRHGLGRKIMEATITWMRGRGVTEAYLDATTDGRPLYRRLGFTDVDLSWYAQAEIGDLALEPLRALADGEVATFRDRAELSRMMALDHQAFGGERMGLLREIMSMPHHWLYAVDETDGEPQGYALVRLLEPPYRGIRIGPWVAATPSVAAALLTAILREKLWRSLPDLAHARDLQIVISVPGTNKDALALLTAAGCALHEDDLIMRLEMSGEARSAPSRHPEWLYGWIAPMLF